MRLIKTSKEFLIGDVRIEVDENENDDPIHEVVDGRKYHSVSLVIDYDKVPLFEPNAFILNCLINERCKDTSQISKGMLVYNKFIHKNNLDQMNTLVPQDEQPIFKFRAQLKALIEEGVYSSSTAAGYLSVVRRYYTFCFAHRYVQDLPFVVSGYNKYGNPITNCKIKVTKRGRRLRPLSERHLKNLFECWHVVPIEFRLGVLLSLFSGMRQIEVTTFKKSLLKIPSDFVGKTFHGISIGPQTDVKTKGDIDREIALPIWLIDLLKQYHDSPRYKERQKKYVEMYGDEEFPALLTQDGDYFETKVFSSLWSKVTKEIRKIDPHYKHKYHDTRATYGCGRMESLNNQTNLTQTQCLAQLKSEMGHVHLTTTQLYLTHWEKNPESFIVTEVRLSYQRLLRTLLGHYIKSVYVKYLMDTQLKL